MSDSDDLEGVTPPRISNEDAERLLSGTSGIDETLELADLSALVSALRGPAEPAELAGLHSALVGFGAAVVTGRSHLPTARTRPMFKKLLTGKAIATIGIVTLASAGAAAAGGGVPNPFASSRPSVAAASPSDNDADDQKVVGEVTHVDTDSLESKAAKAADEIDEGADGLGPNVNGPAKFGLCTAYAARTKHDDTTTTTVTGDADSDLPVPFQSLSDAADEAGQTVAEFCADAVPGGKAEAPGRSDDNPSVTAPGQSGDNPSVTAPGQSGDNPSVTAPGPSGEAQGNSSRGRPDKTND